MRLCKYLLSCILVSLMGINVASAFSSPLAVLNKVTEDSQFRIYLPQLTGLSDVVVEEHLNTVLARNVEHDALEYRNFYTQNRLLLPPAIREHLYFWARYAVKFNKNKIFSTTIEEYTYTGGAHSNVRMYAYTLNTIDGGQYKLEDLFKQGTDYRLRLEGIIKKEISKNSKNYYFNNLKENQSFYLTEEGLVIYFLPYEIGTWADGIVRFVIPFSQLSDILNPAVPLY